MLNLKGIAHPEKQALLKSSNEMLQGLANKDSINLNSDTLAWLGNKSPSSFDIDALLQDHDYDEVKYLDSLNLPKFREHLF